MKLTKVHIALLTNFTEGLVDDEHITMYFSRDVTSSTVIKRMKAINAMLPVDLGDAFQKTPIGFRSWTGEHITALVTNYRRWEPPLVALFEGIEKVHITLAKNEEHLLQAKVNSSEEVFNWRHGGIVGECHAGFKVKGEMEYHTIEEMKILLELGEIVKEIGESPND